MKSKSKKLFIIILAGIAVVGTCGSFYFYHKYESLTVNANAKAQKEENELIADLGKLIQLPANETPSIAVISDTSKLKNQPFFADAENGDVLFAYTTSMKAILYRPSINKLINVAPISTSTTNTQ